MKKLLNTLYITSPDVYLSKDGENLVILQDNLVIKRFPFHIFDSIMCFSYSGASPQLMKHCSNMNILLSFYTPNGYFCGRVIGKTNGNVLLRKKQYKMSDDDTSLDFVRNIIYAKAYNSKKILQRALRDHREVVDLDKLENTIKYIDNLCNDIRLSTIKDQIRGIEGTIAREYFNCFDEMIINQRRDFYFIGRNKRPPKDRVNALLSFLYTLLTHEIVSALEGNGIDSYVGFFHVERPGRNSMALDMIEELRAYLCDRSALTMINKSLITKNDFDEKENGSVLLNDKGRDKVLNYWGTRKHDEIIHPYLNEKIEIGLLPHVQSMLLNRYIREDLDSYPPFLIRG